MVCCINGPISCPTGESTYLFTPCRYPLDNIPRGDRFSLPIYTCRSPSDNIPRGDRFLQELLIPKLLSHQSMAETIHILLISTFSLPLPPLKQVKVWRRYTLSMGPDYILFITHPVIPCLIEHVLHVHYSMRPWEHT